MLQASGVTVSDVCKTTYEEIKKDKKHRYVVFYIKDEKQIDVEYIGMYDLNCYGFILLSFESNPAHNLVIQFNVMNYFSHHVGPQFSIPGEPLHNNMMLILISCFQCLIPLIT